MDWQEERAKHTPFLSVRDVKEKGEVRCVVQRGFEKRKGKFGDEYVLLVECVGDGALPGSRELRFFFDEANQAMNLHGCRVSEELVGKTLFLKVKKVTNKQGKESEIITVVHQHQLGV